MGLLGKVLNKFFLNRWVFILFAILFTVGCSNSYMDDIDRSGGYEYRPGFPEVRLVTAGIVDEITDSTKISLAAEIVYGSIIFKKFEDTFKADVVVDVQILDQTNPSNIIDLIQYPITITQQDSRISLSQEAFLIKRDYPTPPGNYLINFSVTDLSNNKQTVRSSTAYIPNPDENIPHITNIRVFSKNDPLGDTFDPVTTYDLSNNADSIRFVFQVTNNNPQEPLVLNSRLIKFRSDTSYARPMSFPNYNTANLASKGIVYDKFEVINSSRRVINQSGSVSIEFAFPGLDRGNYRFEVSNVSKNETELFKAREFSIKSPNYPSLRTAKELAAPLYYLMGKKEFENMMKIEDEIELKKAIDRFWLNSIKNERIALSVISLFYERVEEANKQFSNFKEGWKTDLGMIYILFGPPWYVTNSLDQTRWSYSHDVYDFEYNFQFRASKLKSRSFPFDNFLLSRNNQYFSIQYQQVQKWLTGTILTDNL